MDENAGGSSARRFLVCAILVFVGSSRTVLAQPSVSLGPGTRVRVAIASTLTASDLKGMAGAGSEAAHVLTTGQTIVLQTETGQELVLPAPGATFAGLVLAVTDRVISIKADRVSRALTVPRAAIAKLERAKGRRSRARYASFGALLGFGAGAVAGATTISCQPQEILCSSALAALSGGIVGVGAGAVAGAIIPPAEQWTIADVAALTSGTLAAPASPSPRRLPPRFTLTFQTGGTSSGPADDIERAMRAGGLADSSPTFGGPPLAHPFSRTGFWAIGKPLVFEVDYAWRSWSIGFVQSSTPIGETSGYRSAGPQYLDVQYQVTSTGLVALKDYQVFRAGGGLAWHRAQSRPDPAAPPTAIAGDDSWASRSRLGAIALAGVRLPKETRVFLDLSVQYRFLARAPVGPVAPYAFGHPPATLDAFDAQFSHWLVAFGPGIRF